MKVNNPDSLDGQAGELQECFVTNPACKDEAKYLPILLYDMHCHIDFAPEPALLASALERAHIRSYSMTLTPEGFVDARSMLAPYQGIRIGLGLHPWWVKPKHDQDTLALFEQYLKSTAFVGEVGLDFAASHQATVVQQKRLFTHISAACAQQGGKLLSVHAVRAVSDVLAIFEREKTLENNDIIFHWFSGTFDELQSAQKKGCYFSIGKRMLQSKRGRSYAQQLALGRILLETDMPFEKGEACCATSMAHALRCALDLLCFVRKESLEEIQNTLAQTSKKLWERP